MTLEAIFAHARQAPARPAIYFRDRAISYGRFTQLIAATRKFFESQGVLPGQTVALQILNPVDAWVALFALQALRVRTVSLPPGEPLDDPALGELACVAVRKGEVEAEAAQAAAAIRRVEIAPEVLAPFISREIAAPEPGVDGGHILYTSGTTGRYKKLLVPQLNEIAIGEGTPYGPDTVYHGLNFPRWTLAGFNLPRHAWKAGGAVIFDLSAERFRRFFDYQPTLALLVPAMARDLLKNLDPQAQPSATLKLWIGAGFLSERAYLELQQRVSRQITISFGSTELGGASVLYSNFATVEDLYWLEQAPGRVIEIVDDEDQPCAVGVEGQLRVQLSPKDCHAYLNDPETTGKVFRDGYFYPGDTAIMRADGRIRVLGRTADVLAVGGRKLPVAPFEQKLQHALGVDEVCMFSVINADGVTELLIALETERSFAREQLEAAAKSLPAFQRTRIVTVAEFPRTRAGTRKVLRRVLRQQLQQRLASAASADVQP